MLTLERIEGQAWAEQLREEWRALAADSRTATPFQTWDWASCWWSQFAGSRRPFVVAIREGADLVGIAPLYRTRGPWRALRMMGTGQSDYLHPLARTGYEDRVATELVGHLRNTKNVDLVDLHQIRETLPLASTAPAEIREQARCCVLDLPATYDEYLQRLSKSLRYDAKKLDREPFLSGKAHIVTAATPETACEFLEIFLQLHATRWRRRGLPGAFALPRVKRFQREFVALAVQQGLLRLSVLEFEGRAVGALYAMKAGNSFFFYQSGFDPAANALCPGSVLVAHTIRMAIGEGAAHFDFLRGDEAYKLRWKPQHTYRNVRLMWKLSSVAGSIGEAWNDAGRHVEGALRKRLEGKGLIS